jgi:hypothetical protein
MNRKGIEYSVKQVELELWKWQFQIGETVTTGRTRTRLMGMAAHRVQQRIDCELNKARGLVEQQGRPSWRTLSSSVRDGGLVGAEVIGGVAYQREECMAQASICREKALADPAKYDYWIDEAIVWHQRAIGTGPKSAVTHEVQDERMIPKPVH